MVIFDDNEAKIVKEKGITLGDLILFIQMLKPYNYPEDTELFISQSNYTNGIVREIEIKDNKRLTISNKINYV